jgi:gas vesicle protein
MRDQINDFTSTAAENFTTSSDRVLDAILDGNRQVVDTAVKTADQVIEQLPEMPWTDQFPTPTEVGANYLDFVERAVEANRDFNQRVAEMLTADPTVAVKDAGDKATKAAKDTGDRVTKVAKDTGDRVTQVAKDTGDRVTKVAKDTGDRVTKVVKPAPAPKKAAAKKSTPKKSTPKKAAAKKAAPKSTQTPGV